MQLNRYYFTFDVGHNLPFRGGYVLVLARDINSAARIFNEYHPCDTPDEVNCSEYYSAEQFQEKYMQRNGEYKGVCHEVIGPHYPIKNRINA